MNSFSDFGLLPSLLKTLKEKKINKPTEIQINAIPLMMSKQSVVGVSETGSGKTLAYALPLLHMLKSMENEKNSVELEGAPRAIIMVPTRELGEQVSKVFKTLTHDTRLRVRPALGGMTLEQARRNTEGFFEILLATPGRLTQMMDLDLINMTDVKMLIFDEADQMMDQGFLPDSNKIRYACPKDVQMALFSATVSPAVQDLINNLFAGAEVIRSKGSGKVVSSLTTKKHMVVDGKRWPLFDKIMEKHSEGGTIIFANTREQVDAIAEELGKKGYDYVVYRGEMDKNERRQNLKKFRDGKVDLLVATDIAGRGLDIENVGRVINFHLPRQKENYLHRAGRTARAGRPGVVVNLVTERDERLMAQLEGRKAKPFSERPYVKAAQEKAKSTKGGKPAGKSFDKPTGKPSGKPVAKSAGSPAAKPFAKPSSKPMAKASPKSFGSKSGLKKSNKKRS